MLEILRFIFSGFWVFIGSFLIIGMIVRGVVALACVIRGVPIGDYFKGNSLISFSSDRK